MSGTLTVQAKDAFGNVSDTAETVNLSTSNTNTGLFKDNSTGNTITSVSIPSGSSTASFKYVDTLVSTPTLTASATGLTSAMQTETVIAATASQLIFTTSAQTLTAGMNSATITVQLEDPFNNIATASSTQTILLTTTSEFGQFRDNATGNSPIIFVNLAAGTSSTNFKYNDTLAGSPMLTVTDFALTSSTATQTETVNAATVSKLVYTTTAQTLTAGVVSGTLTVQEEDAFGNVTTTAETVNLSTSNTTTGLFKDNATGATITSVSIALGSSTASFQYVDTLVSTPTLTASSTGLTSAMQTETVIAATATQLVYTTTAQTLTAGVNSSTITVQEEDTFGNPTTTAETVNLSTSNTSTGLFKDNSTGATITSVSIASGFSTASFKYVDTLVSTPTLTAAATGLTSAMQTETVIAAAASKLIFITAPQTVSFGVVSGTLTIQEQDAFGNVTTTAETVNLSTSNTGTGLFYSDATGHTLITSVSIASGSSTASFYYKDTLASTPTLTAAATGLTPATQTETITGLTVTSFTPSANGFTVTFIAPFNPATLNVNGPVTSTAPVAVTLVGSGNIGPVTGSLYLNSTDTQATFVTTALVGSNGLPISTGTLPLGTYTVTLISGSNAFTTTTGQLLDGNANGSDNNYTQTFHVVASNPGSGDVLLPSSAVIVNVPDFARGPNTPNVTIPSSNGAVESSNTVTITTTTGHGFSVGQTVVISGVGVSGYNGTFVIASVPTATMFTYTDSTSNLTASGGGTANVPDINVVNNSANGIPIDLTVLAPVQTITLSSPITTGTTGTFKLGFNGQTTANITVGTTIKVATTSGSTSGASESGTTVTIRTSSVHGLKAGETVTISGVGVEWL